MNAFRPETRILYVDIDSLRPDHLGCYGYHRDTSPNIDAVAGNGVRFESVYSSDVPCLPSRTALVTGMYGIRNGVAGHGGVAADLRPWGPTRGFNSPLADESLFGVLRAAGYHTATISSFALRHSAPWWLSGFLESHNPAGGIGLERADEVMPGALAWLDQNGRAGSWFLHVQLWDPHTPYTTPDGYGNPFSGDPPPAWHTAQVRERNWDLPGPHSARDLWGFSPAEWGPLPSRAPAELRTDDDVKRMFDGYDVGIRFADEAVGALCSKLDDLGVLGETAILVTSDHGEAFGELGVYADHQAADEVVTHVPAILSWPGIEPGVQAGLHYQLDVAATLADLAGTAVPEHWDGVSLRGALERRSPALGREFLVLSQGAWSCQRAVRLADRLFLRTFHDGFHGAWPDEMLFDIVRDPHEETDLASSELSTVEQARRLLSDWTSHQLGRALAPEDPLDTIVREGGPYHVRGHLGSYVQRLRATGRSPWADVLLARHGAAV
jgi:arylsulfatase A-like enzyme